MEEITLISSDNHPIKVDSKSAQKSLLLKKIISESNKGNEELKLNNIRYDILKRIVEYLEYYRNKVPKEIPKPTPSENLNSFLDDWDFKFINNINLDDTFELMNGASELSIQSLLDLASSKVASILKSKSIEDIRSLFTTGEELSEKELKKYDELQL